MVGFLATLCLLALPQEVELTLTDGTVVRGVAAAEPFKDGAYHVTVAGKPRVFPAAQVVRFQGTQLPPPAPTPPISDQPKPGEQEQVEERARSLAKEGRFQEAAAELNKARARIKSLDQSVRNQIVSYQEEAIRQHLAAGRAGDAVAALHDASADMNTSELEASFNTLMAEAERRAAEQPLQSLTHDLVVCLAEEAASNGRLGEAHRARARAQLTGLSGALTAAGGHESAERLLRRAVEIFPAASGELTGMLTEAMATHGRRLMEQREYEKAAGVLGRLVTEFPGHAEAQTLHDTALLEGVLARMAGRPAPDAVALARHYLNRGAVPPPGFSELRQREWALVQEMVNRAKLPEAIVLLTEYLGQELPESYRQDASRQLVRLQTFVPPVPAGQETPAVAAAADAGTQLARYYPVAVGAEYHYVINTPDRRAVIVRTLVVEKDERSGVTIVRSERSERHPVYEGTSPLEMRIADGKVFKDMLGTENVLLRFPAAKGDQWTWSALDQVFTSTILSTGASVVTPAGVFRDCVEVELSSSVRRAGEIRPYRVRSYYAPGIGLVKIEYDEKADQHKNLELVKYVPPAAPSKDTDAPAAAPVVPPPPGKVYRAGVEKEP